MFVYVVFSTGPMVISSHVTMCPTVNSDREVASSVWECLFAVDDNDPWRSREARHTTVAGKYVVVEDCNLFRKNIPTCCWGCSWCGWCGSCWWWWRWACGCGWRGGTCWRCGRCCGGHLTALTYICSLPFVIATSAVTHASATSAP